MTDRPRVVRPVRNQVELVARDLDAFIASDHPVRAVWAFVQDLDLSVLLEQVRAVEHGPGRPAADPYVLFALWMYATVEGVGSARLLDRLTREHDAYRWLRGGVPLDYHTLSDFRVGHVEVLEAQLVAGVAALIEAGLVKLQEVAQDGIRVRASAGAGSYRTPKALRGALEEAEAQVEALRKELEDDPGKCTRRQAAARERAARERVERITAAQKRFPELEARKKRKGKVIDDDDDAPPPPAAAAGGEGASADSAAAEATAPSPEPESPVEGEDSSEAAPPEPEPAGVVARAARNDGTQVRASTTDPTADVMKMGDNGYRPAYNGQSCVDTGSGIVLAVTMSNVGSDGPHLLPMVEKIQKDYGRKPSSLLTDGGFVSRENVRALHALGIKYYGPPPKPPRGKGIQYGRYDRRPRDCDVVAEWRARMGTPEAAAIYRRRASTVEWVNAQYRNRGLQQYRVRGTNKVLAVFLWQALAANMTTAARLNTSS